MTNADDTLDDLFARASDDRIVPSDALMARILADAAAEQPRPQPLASAKQPAPSRSGFGFLTDWFGGTRALAGMSAAALAGLFIGVAQPSYLVGLTTAISGEVTLDSMELMPATGTLWGEN